MDSIFHGDLAAPGGRRLAWIDSLLIDHAALRLVWTNAAAVVPRLLYRSNHPTPGRLMRTARRYGLRSIINLRGQTRSGSDALLRDRALRLGLDLRDVPMSSGRAPSREALLSLIDALQTAPPPVLVYCKSGADRSGFAAAVYLLLQGRPIDAALGQLSLRFGHLRRSRAGVLDAVLRRYAAEAGAVASFSEWVARKYDPQAVERDFRAGRVAGFVAGSVLRRE